MSMSGGNGEASVAATLIGERREREMSASRRACHGDQAQSQRGCQESVFAGACAAYRAGAR